MSENHSSGSGSYQINLLKSDNWMPWKRRMLAILRDQDLKKFINKDAAPSKLSIPGEETKEEIKAISKWKQGDAKTHTRIELAVGDSEIIHLSGAMMAKEMWKQLSTVKEARGRLGVLATQ